MASWTVEIKQPFVCLYMEEEIERVSTIGNVERKKGAKRHRSSGGSAVNEWREGGTIKKFK